MTAQHALHLRQQAAAWTQRNDHARAHALYCQLAAMGEDTRAEMAGSLLALGRNGQAHELMSQAITDEPAQPRWWWLRALTQLQAGHLHDALADLDACLQRDPGQLAARQKRAAVYMQLDQLEDARQELEDIAQRSPADAMAHANLGIIHLRSQDYDNALLHLRRARALAPAHTSIAHSLANALAGTGQLVQALSMFAQLEAQVPDSPALLADHALCQLAAGQATAAQRRYQRVLARYPSDAWALMGSYLCALSADTAEMPPAHWMDYQDLRQPIGSIDTTLCQHLLVLAKSHPRLRRDPLGKSTYGGQQSCLLDLSVHSDFHCLLPVLQQAATAYIHAMGTAPHANVHGWHRNPPAHWRLQAWVTVLEGSGGHQRPHIHPAGWASGVVYLDAGNDGPDGGMLVFGHPPDHLRLQLSVPEHCLIPADARLIMFPSHFLHHTTPYHGTRPRVSIAFDVVPA